MLNNKRIVELDNYLLQTIKYLKNKWFKSDVGFVSCAVIDGHKITFGTNIIHEEGKILHAELNVLNGFKKLYGRLSDNGVAIMTLSPCIEFSKNRIGPACAPLLFKNNIKRIHFGHLHDKQGTIETYNNLGFIPTLTENKLLNSISKNLLQFYLDNKKSLMNNFDAWAKAKRVAGYSLFKGI